MPKSTATVNSSLRRDESASDDDRLIRVLANIELAEEKLLDAMAILRDLFGERDV